MTSRPEPSLITLDATFCPTPDNPVPPGGVCGELTAADGVRLRFGRWPAAPGVPRQGTVAMLTGRDGYLEKYFESIRDLTARGFAVASLDWRGQGGSERALPDPRKGHVSSFGEYQLDLDVFIRQVLLPDCPPPHFGLAHSMGAAILLKALADGRQWFDRSVLSAPMLALGVGHYGELTRKATRMLASCGFANTSIPTFGLPQFTRPSFENNVLTGDRARYARIRAIAAAHPRLPLGPPTFGWTRAALDAMAELADPATIRRIRAPLLIVAAGADRVVSNDAIEHLASRLLAGRALTIPSAAHEILLDTDRVRAQFWAAFDAFIPGSDPLQPRGL